MENNNPVIIDFRETNQNDFDFNHNNNNYNMINQKGKNRKKSKKSENKPPAPSLASVDQATRIGFIRKVYGILLTQLIISFGLCFLTFIDSFKIWLILNPWWLYLSISVIFVSLIILSCFRKLARRVPINYIMLLVITLATAMAISYLCAKTDRTSVLCAFGITVSLVLALTVFSFFVKVSFKFLYALIFTFMVIFIITLILALVIVTRWFAIMLSGIGVVLYSLLLISDTQLIIGKGAFMYSIDDYILAAMNLYFDIILIFVSVLGITSASR